MSKVVNDMGLPQQLFDALYGFQFQPLNANEMRVTETNSDIRQVMLRRRHNDVEVGASSQFNFLMGNAVHEYVGWRVRKQENVILADDKRFSVVINGVKVSGKPDLFMGGILYDYKTCGTYAGTEVKESYRIQLSIYAYLLRKNGMIVTQGVLVYFFKDFNRATPMRTKGVVTAPIMNKVVDLMSDAEVEAYLNNVTLEFLAAHALDDNSLPACSDDQGYNKCDYCEFANTGLCNKVNTSKK